MKINSITFKIIHCAFEVHNQLGLGFMEKVYRNSLAYELKLNGFSVVVEKPIKVLYKDNIVGKYFADIVVNDSIILEIKSVNKLILPHIYQIKNYLKASEYDIGFLFNFNSNLLDYRRIFP